MGKNVPVWTKQVLGRAMTPGEFLASDEAQDKVFDAMFDGYVKQFGLGGAAQAWIGGPGSVGKTDRTDVLGTSVGKYGQMFMSFYNGFGEPTAAVASADQQPLSAAENEPLYKAAEQQVAAGEPAIADDEQAEGGVAQNPDITAPEVDLSQPAAAPQVEDEEDEDNYAQGGVIPEEDGVQRFQTGGQPDPYSPGRQFTQAIAQPSVRPRAATFGGSSGGGAAAP